MNDQSVDLIATDPPFKKGRDFHATPDRIDKSARFQDRWSWEKDVKSEWLDEIYDSYRDVWEVIDAANQIHMKKTKENLKKERNEVGSDVGAFLCFMAVRLLEMKRILKETGSIFLHCDYSVGHYIKILLDAIFGKKSFCNEIVWCYLDVGGGRNTDYYKTKHDTIFWYAKNAKKKRIGKLARGPLSETTISRFGSLFDEKGEITYRKLKNQRPDEFKSRKNQGRVPKNLDEVFLSKERGRLLEDHWNDINPIRKRRKSDDPSEPFWYPTQKPMTLYKRIIETATQIDDMVLDPFCGCATTILAAESLGRKWVGIDIWDKTEEVILARMRDENFYIDGETPKNTPCLKVHFKKEVPIRTDDGKVESSELRVKVKVQEPPGKRWSRQEMFEHLLDQQGYQCKGCDKVFNDCRYLELDHNIPVSDGGINHISNRLLLCGPCNKLKSNIYTLSGLRRQNKKLGYMK